MEAGNIKHLATLNSLYLSGPSNYLELERRLGMSGLHRTINYLQQLGLIVGLPKKAKDLRQYKLTKDGLKRLGKIPTETKHVYEPLTRVYEPFVFVEFNPARNGAMDAMKIKSKGIGA